MVHSAKPLAPNLSGSGFESRVAYSQTERGTLAGSGANIACVPNVGSSVRVHLKIRNVHLYCHLNPFFFFNVRSFFFFFLPFAGLAPESLLAAIFISIFFQWESMAAL